MKNKLKLAGLKRQLKKSINAQRHYHGQWMEYRHKGDHRRGHGAMVLWQKQVRATQKIQAQIQLLQAQMGAGATTPSLAIAKAIGQWEGGQSSDKKFHPYWDNDGRVWTIGFGHTSFDSPVDAHTKPLTMTEAVALLLHDLSATYGPQVAAYLKQYGIKATQKQFDAFVSFAYNDGTGPFQRGHTFGDLLHARNLNGAADSLTLYVHAANGAALPGLVRRRGWERQLARGGTYTVNN